MHLRASSTAKASKAEVKDQTSEAEAKAEDLTTTTKVAEQ